MSKWTLAEPCRLETDARKSRFLAQAAPVPDPDAAAVWIASVSVAAATHNCWAFRVGQTYRTSDDGEPAGTAGRPILAAIDGQDMDQVAVVVTRWFGGIKLGAGGLVRAYGGAAAQCLQRGERLAIVPTRRLELACAFALESAVRGLVEDSGGSILSQSYLAQGMVLTVEVPESGVAVVVERVRDLSRGQARVSPAG